ncbi:MAG: hypothetical protein O3B84_07195, partial [Chloroflexi bacterium]|nr:hypothetical protein [Chloroflexota bacterium]
GGGGADVGGASVGIAIATAVGDKTAVGSASAGAEDVACAVAVGGIVLLEQAVPTIPRVMIVARSAKRTVDSPH